MKEKEEIIPQYDSTELYITPFTQIRTFHPDTGKISYVPLERDTTPTGILAVDEFLNYLTAGSTYTHSRFVSSYNVSESKIRTVIEVLTGMKYYDFFTYYSMALSDDLLIYTSLSIAEIAKRCGLANTQCLTLRYLKYYENPPTLQRQMMRRENDCGKYKL